MSHGKPTSWDIRDWYWFPSLIQQIHTKRLEETGVQFWKELFKIGFIQSLCPAFSLMPLQGASSTEGFSQGWSIPPGGRLSSWPGMCFVLFSVSSFHPVHSTQALLSPWAHKLLLHKCSSWLAAAWWVIHKEFIVCHCCQQVQPSPASGHTHQPCLHTSGEYRIFIIFIISCFSAFILLVLPAVFIERYFFKVGKLVHYFLCLLCIMVGISSRIQLFNPILCHIYTKRNQMPLGHHIC